MNFIDRIISYFNPLAGMKRAMARFQLDSFGKLQLSGRLYEGASKKGRFEKWIASDSSASTEVRNGAKVLRDRARHLRRNNPYANRVVQVIATNVVGDGIRPQLNHENKEARSLKIAIEKWWEWAEHKFCDFVGQMNIYQMQSIVAESVVESGEIFIIRHRLGKSNGQVPLKIQLLESDFLATHVNETLKDGGTIIDGIEYDSVGEIKAYHFHKRHPGDRQVLNLHGLDTVRIDASRVLHIFRPDRPHQNRGVTWFAPVMSLFFELDHFQDATLRKQQMAAALAAFFVDPTGAMLEKFQQEGKPIELFDTIESGTVTVAPPGVDMRFTNPPPAGDYPEFMKQVLRAIASGLGITYEVLTNDYSQVNFSSGRMGFIEMNRNIRRWQREIIIDQMMDPIFKWFTEAVDLITPGNIDMSKIWTQWTKPPREVIDPSKEIPAAREAIRMGQTTLSEVIRSRGMDPEAVFAERAREIQALKKLGIVTDSDPSTDHAKQLSQSNQNNGSEEDADEPDDSDEDSKARSSIPIPARYNQ